MHLTDLDRCKIYGWFPTHQDMQNTATRSASRRALLTLVNDLKGITVVGVVVGLKSTHKVPDIRVA